MEDASAQRAQVGKFIAHNLMGHKPTNEDAGEEAHDGQENLAGYEVEPVEQWTAKKDKFVSSAK